MSQFKATKLPCPDCGSSDARAEYHSGVSICFSCGTIKAPDAAEGTIKIKDGAVPFIFDVDVRGVTARGLRQDTCKRYGYGFGKTKHGKPVHVAPYYDDKGRLVAQKLRTKTKDFVITGDASKMGLFGLQLAREGGKKIVITEGEIDALSVSQAMGNTWPVVSLPNGSGSLSALKDNLEFLESYEQVVLCFDNDEPGQKATEAALSLFSPGKAYVMNLGDYKDPNEMIQAGATKELRNAVWEAKEYRPDGVVNLDDIKDRILERPKLGWPYPWQELTDLTCGMRPEEVITWTAGTGVGKTALVSEVMHHLAVVQEHRVGVIYLEEGLERAGRRIVGIEMSKPVHLPTAEYTDDEFEVAYQKTIGTRRIFAYDHFGSLESEKLVNRIRHMVRGDGCDIILLDHVSMVVSGNATGDERKDLDVIMTKLASLAQETGACIHVVSHLRRTSSDKSHEEGLQVSLSHLRGTQAIAQLSHTVIAAERNQQEDDSTLKNTTTFRVLKCRYTGQTGIAGAVLYDHETGRLTSCPVPGDDTPVTTFGENGDY